jgi:hypothetical protein
MAGMQFLQEQKTAIKKITPGFKTRILSAFILKLDIVRKTILLVSHTTQDYAQLSHNRAH